MLYFKAKMHQNSISAGVPPQTSLWSSQRSPDHLAVFKGGKGEGGEKGKGGKARVRDGRGVWGRAGKEEKGRKWGDCLMGLVDGRPCPRCRAQ